jgi:hypothetical protein
MWDDAPIQMPYVDGVFTEALDRRQVVRAASGSEGGVAAGGRARRRGVRSPASGVAWTPPEALRVF